MRVQNLIRDFGVHGTSVFHNCYSDDMIETAKIERWNGSIVFLRREENFHRLLFITRDVDELAGRLTAILDGRDICLNYLCAGSMPEALDRALTEAFPVRLRHERLVKTKFGPAPSAPEYALENETDFLFDALRRNFNKYDSFLPTRDAVFSHVRNRTVLVTREDEAISAFLLYTCKGKVAHSNFTLSLRKNIHDVALLRQASYSEFFARGIRAAYTWVNPETNARLLRAYLLSGFSRENRFNYFYIRTGKQ